MKAVSGYPYVSSTHGRASADQATRLAQAVTDSKLTQAQADYIMNAQKEITAIRGTAEPGQATDAERTSIRAKIDALRAWATTNNVDEQYVGPGDRGGPDGDAPIPTTSAAN